MTCDAALHPFLAALPNLIFRQNASDIKLASKRFQKYCKSVIDYPDYPHEFPKALLHTKSFISKRIYLQALEAYHHIVRNRKSPPSLNLHLFRLHNGSSSTATPQLPLIPDVALHFRCGDSHFGAMQFKVYRDAIQSAKLVSGTIYILSDNPDRFHNINDNQQQRCSTISDLFFSYLVHYFPRFTIAVLCGGDPFDDLLRLTYAKILVCSASTFCLLPAIAQSNPTYFPNTKLIAGGTKPDYGPHMHWVDERHLIMMYPSDVEGDKNHFIYSQLMSD